MFAAKKLLLALALTSAAGCLQAAPVTLDGASFSVTYDDALVGLFGTPTLSGNTLFFTPTSFKAISTNGAGVSLASQTSNFDILLKPSANLRLTSVNLNEGGDYLMMGQNSFVNALGQMRVRNNANPSMEIVGSIASATPLAIKDGINHNWAAGANADLNSAAWNNVGSARVTLENILLAYTQADTGPQLAFAEKKYAGITFNTFNVSPVPEASTWSMMLLGVGLLGYLSLRRRNQQ